MHPFGRKGWALLAVAAVAFVTLPSAVRAYPAGRNGESEVDAPIAPAAVRLLEPAAGTVLSGGSTVTLAWEPGPGMSVEGVEEWEAFLSLDGGSSWPIRITPHLDLALRRVSFPVPAVPSDDVRLLLRIGDERQEMPFMVPGRFSIVARPSTILPAASIRYESGESALPGSAGVIAWVEGTRQGGGFETAIALPLGSGWNGVHLVSLDHFPIGAEPDPPIHELFPHARTSAVAAVPTPRTESPRPRSAPPGSRAILLSIERLDE